ncbi:MAG TPA: S41 family peptidase [Candidatus Saccharimonadales bacterium]|nr:S41 family peptidase [Candidatus Saccharimonadales bacterium]
MKIKTKLIAVVGNWKSSRRLRKGIQIGSALVAAFVLFAVGVGVGDGRISLHSGGSTLNASLPDKLDYSTVNQVYQSLRDNYDGTLTEQQLIDGLKHGLAESTHDPYTVYFTAKEAQDFNNQLNQSFSGIGAELGKDSDGNLIVVSPITGFPADKAGLKPQDIITTINGKSTSGITIDSAVNLIRGKAGTNVVLEVVRNHSDQLSFTITRQNIQVPSVTTKILNGNIGYIQISTFADDTSGLIQKAADQLKQANVKGIILDLRNDPGGLLNAAVDVTSKWLPEGTLVLQEKRGSTVVNSYNAEGGDELHGIPTVVLINDGSASASEITTGALHDNHAAYVIGTKSYGKGVVQQLINFNDGSQLKVTIASWYRPDGENINHKGITPDQTVQEPSTATPDNDPQLQAAETYLSK